MAGSHIAIFEIPAAGHINPALALCGELVNRGHRVTFPTDYEYQEQVKREGAIPVLFNSVKPESTLALTGIFDRVSKDEPNWWNTYATVLYPWFVLNAAAAVARLEAIYDDDPPDVVIYDRLAFAGRIIGHRLKAPMIQIYPHFAYDDCKMFREDGVSVNPPPMLDFARLLDRFYAVYGICQEGNLWHTEALNIYFIPPEFQFTPERFDARSRFVGPCLKRSFKSVWKSEATRRPLILISEMMGAGTGFFPIFIEALRSMDVQVVLSVGKTSDMSDIVSLPPSFSVNRDASHLEILPGASLSICQGGMGSTLEAMYYGVPVIAMPLTRFHEEVAFRMVELGLGRRLERRSATAAEIRNCVNGVLADQALRRRVKQMQVAIMAADGEKTAADAIEAFLAERRHLSI